MRSASILYGCEWILWGQSSNITHCKSPAFPLAALSALVGVVDVAFVVDADRSAGSGVSFVGCATESESATSFNAAVAAAVAAVATVATAADEFVIGETDDADNSIGVSASMHVAIGRVALAATGDGNIGATLATGVADTG